MRNVRPDESQARIKIAKRNISNFRYADDTTLMAESEEELKNLLMKVKEEHEKADENSAVATGLEKVSFHSNPKERQCQRMLKLPHNCAHLTH